MLRVRCFLRRIYRNVQFEKALFYGQRDGEEHGGEVFFYGERVFYDGGILLSG